MTRISSAFLLLSFPLPDFKEKMVSILRTPINYLLVHLAVADIVYAAFIAPKGYFKLTSVHHPDGMTGLVLCKLLTGGNVAWVGAVASAIFLVVIAFERYYAVMYPHGHKWKLSTRKLKVSDHV